MLFLRANPSSPRTNEQQHQSRRKRDRKERRDSHGEVLRKGERLKELSLLRFEGEDRHERERDDQQREEAWTSDFLNRADQRRFVVAAPPTRFPCLELLV